MDKVMEYLQSVNWDTLGTVLTDFVDQINLPGFVENISSFIKDLIAAIAASV